MSARPLALLVDTYSLLFRAHHALPPMNTKSGEPTSALYGFCAALLRELTQRQPLELAFAVDAPQRTFRHEALPSYKGTRDATPEPLVAQFARLRELLAAFEVPVFEVPGVEADDVLATLAAELGAGDRPVLVMSGILPELSSGYGLVPLTLRGIDSATPEPMSRWSALSAMPLA